jgi:hypothetical protein
MDPPPMRATDEMEWWGERKGLLAISAFLSLNFPATECILVVSSASWRDIGGNMLEILLASIVLPAPGGPIMILMGVYITPS